MGGKTAIGVHHQLPAGQAGIGGGTTLHEPAGRVDEDLHVLGEAETVQNGIQHLGDDLPPKLLQIFSFIVLDGHHNVFHTHGFSVLIHHGHLGFAIGTNAPDGSILHRFVQTFADVVCENHRDGQTGPGFPGGVAVHGALVAGAGGGEHILAAAIPHFQRGIHAAGDVGTLPVDIDEHDEFHGVVAHFAEDFPNHRADVDLCRAGDLPADKDFPLGGHDLAGAAGIAVVPQTLVQNAVGDQVAQLVRVTAPDAFSRFIFGHTHFPFRADSSRSITSSWGVAPPYSLEQFSLTIW
nr:MAG TPA: hypothetical protein [Caudoviricetes sp.]